MTDVKQSVETDNIVYVVVRQSDSLESFLACILHAHSHAKVETKDSSSTVTIEIDGTIITKTLDYYEGAKKKYVMYQTEKLFTPDEKMQKMKNIILIGNYYNENLHLFDKDANIEIYSLYDVEFKHEFKNVKYNNYYSNHCFGIFVYENLVNDTDSRFMWFLIYLRECMYGLLTNSCTYFFLGIDQFFGKTLYEKIITAYVSDKTVDEIEEMGKSVYDKLSVKMKGKIHSKLGSITYCNMKYSTLTITDDTTSTFAENIVMMCYVMNDYPARNIKLVIAYRHDKSNKTTLTLRPTKNVYVHASDVVKKLFPGSYGTNGIGYATIDKVIL